MFFTNRRLRGSRDSLWNVGLTHSGDSRLKVGRIIASKGNEITEREKNTRVVKFRMCISVGWLRLPGHCRRMHVAAQRAARPHSDESQANLFVFLSRLCAACTIFTDIVSRMFLRGTYPSAPSTSLFFASIEVSNM